jgi:hypothetical protein
LMTAMVVLLVVMGYATTRSLPSALNMLCFVNS